MDGVDFELASQWVASNAGGVSSSELLELYGLFKQATIGDCREPKPSFYEVRAVSKWYRVGIVSQPHGGGSNGIPFEACQVRRLNAGTSMPC